MGANSGTKVSRRKVDTYKGFDIIKKKTTYYHHSAWRHGYDTSWVDRVEQEYTFCKEGESNRPSQEYNTYRIKTIQECKDEIDKFIKDDSLYFTDEEREKYVYKPNRKCEWRFGYDSLMKIVREHKKTDKRMKILLEDRLEDANFHYECGLLCEKKYDELVDYIKKEYTFRQKFEIITHTQSKRIKNPQQFEEGLQKVIEDYFAKQEVGTTTAEVKLIKDW